MANNTTYKPNEGKREEFRRYLEKTGVMDALTKALVLLYEEPDKPDDALKFIQNSLARQVGSDTIDDMKSTITQLEERVAQLENDNRVLSENMTAGGGGVAEGEGGLPAGSPSAGKAAGSPSKGAIKSPSGQSPVKAAVPAEGPAPVDGAPPA